jgi:ADP-ribose pyrophosphatase YjhB (NUDIX family)
MTDTRLPDSLWRTIQRSVPIFCVDVVPVCIGSDGALNLGLILRDTPSQGDRWCLIGGRLLLDETISEAVDRELKSALGESLSRSSRTTFDPIVAEYRRKREPGALHDPRQHAISATVPIWMSGEGIPQGPEAQRFQWWNIDRIGPDGMGFGQESLIPRIKTVVEAQPF